MLCGVTAMSDPAVEASRRALAGDEALIRAGKVPNIAPSKMAEKGAREALAPIRKEPYYSDSTTALYLGDALDVAQQLDSNSANCIVTSPPYFGLRDYGVDGQYGLESSPADYVETMRAVFAELRRVLSDDGTLWLNLGDSYVHKNVSGPQGAVGERASRSHTASGAGGYAGLPDKNLLGIPWRVAFALQDDGWILRSDIIWAKRNLMPESVTDRPTRAHEHVFLLTKAPRYWYDADAIREKSDPAQEAHNQRYAKEYTAHTERAGETGQPGNVNNVGIHSRTGRPGRNARDVWSISAQPFPGAHFATMPVSLAERCVQAGCKPGGTVLDPFSGSGTTGLAAARHGRKYVGIDLSRDYLDLSLRTRLAEPTLDFEAGA